MPDKLTALDRPTVALVRLSARITGGTESDVRAGLAECAAAAAPDRWIEELVLQSYLFAGFPRALNAAREWARARESVPGTTDGRSGDGRSGGGNNSFKAYAAVDSWRLKGEATCRVVYGEMYEKLRSNIRGLHPALDEWMIVEGYGKVLSREGLDLPRRELCIVAACVAAGQERQLHSHLHGSRNAGVADDVIAAVLAGLEGVVAGAALQSATMLFEKTRNRKR